MRRYHLWLAALGMLAVAPGITLAAPPQSLSSEIAQTTKKSPNQQAADAVAGALQQAKVPGKIEVGFQAGTARLMGTVNSEADRAKAEQVVARVRGVRKVENKLKVAPGWGSKQTASAPARAQARRPSPISQAAYQDEDQTPPPPFEAEPVQPGPAYQGPPPGYQGPPPGMMPHAVPAGQPAPGYDQPNMPNYAWPSYAQYPNSAAVTYPTQYSASAWPYIGPFYPYPQVPMGWRKAQLEWDDGYWQLNFRPRTDKWWWFMNPQNW